MRASNGKPVEVEIEGNGDGTAFVAAAWYIDSGDACDDAECEYLTDEYPELMDEWVFDNALMHAEYYYGGDR